MMTTYPASPLEMASVLLAMVDWAQKPAAVQKVFIQKGKNALFADYPYCKSLHKEPTFSY